MPMFTIERTYLLPVYQHVTLEAETADDAMQAALDHDDWESAEKDYDNSRATYISGAWEGEEDYNGDCLPIPARFRGDEEPDDDDDTMIECECGADVDSSIRGQCDECGKAVLA